MPKYRPIQLSIPEPCSENWEKMHKVGTDRRYCDRCVKQVTDFTQATDGQILAAYRRADGNLCGRFRANQLDRRLLDTARPASWWSKAATWLGLMFAGTSIVGQETKHPSLDSVQIVNAAPTQSDIQGRFKIGREQNTVGTFQGEILVTGVVKDQEGNPLIGASILIKGTTTGTVTDFDGLFEIKAAAHSQLVISYTGFESKTIVVDPLKAVKTKDGGSAVTSELVLSVAIELADDNLILAGEMIVVGGIGRHRPNTLFDEFKWMLRRWKYNREERAEERAERRAERKANRAEAKEMANDKKGNKEVFAELSPFVVFPNPSAGPLNLQFKSEVEQQLMVEVIDATGKPVYFSPWKVFVGLNALTLSTEQLTGVEGTYFIRLVGAEKMWTEKVVVKE